MITSRDINLIRKARIDKKKWEKLTPDELQAYQNIHRALNALGQEAKEAVKIYGDFELNLTSGFSLKSGVRGSLPKDLWFSLSPTNSNLGMPQIYLIVSDKGLEYGFAPVIHPSDFSDAGYKKRIIDAAPSIVAAFPDANSILFQELNDNLNKDRESRIWHIKRKSRQFYEQDEFTNLADYTSFIKNKNIPKSWWGAISRYVAIDELDSEQNHLSQNVINTARMFGPYIIEIAKNISSSNGQIPTETIRELLLKFMSDFPEVSKRAYGVDNGLWSTMSNTRQKIENIISAVPNSNDIIVKHSVGKGNWAKIPWFALLHKNETNTTEAGVYGVYLFNEDMSGVYLCIAMGVTEFSKEHGKKETHQLLQNKARNLTQSFLPLKDIGFTEGPIDLKASTQLGQNYESSVVISKYYSLESMPSEGSLGQDLKSLMNAYVHYVRNKDLYTGLLDQSQNNFNGQRIWVMALGEGSKYQEQFHNNGIIAIGWDYLGDLVKYQSSDEIRKRMVGIEESEKPYNNAKCCYDFAHVMSKGDLVFIRKGVNKVIGYGYVDGDYIFDEKREFYKSTRKFNWSKLGSWTLDDKFHTKTLTELTDYPEFVQKIKAIIGFDVQPQENNKEDYPLYSIEEALDGLFISQAEFEKILNMWKNKKNAILQGPPGVGKTFVAKRLAYALMGYKNPEQCRMVQFHQSYSYEDFIQGYRPSKDGFSLKYGVFYTFCQEAIANPDQPYIFIIDEINRGNISKILGETMMLVECDKRGPEWGIPLTYSDSETFYIPENLYILGMMNTADRSLSLVDYALRRRFSFIDLLPQIESDKFSQFLKSKGTNESTINAIKSRIGELNNKICSDEINLGEGFQIGHSYFCPKDLQIANYEWYAQVIEAEIIPLLKEYWFDDKKEVESWRGRLLAKF